MSFQLANGELANGPVAITGMHRSGTSMVTRALHDSGLYLVGDGAEELIDAAEDNPEGFWENKAIVACNDELLEAAGGSWDNPPEVLPQAVDDPRVAHVAESATSALRGLSEHERWGFKDPRTCLTAAYWLDLQPDLRFVICVRHPLEVALSLKRRNQNSYSLGLALWERYYTSVLATVPVDRRIVTHYDTFFVDPAGEIDRLCVFAGLTPTKPTVRTDLRHHTMHVGLADAGVSPSLRALYADLCRQAGVATPPEPPADEGRVRRLILDGGVAQRHADQRQAAIDRLNEREIELREEFGRRVRDLEFQHRDRVRVLEERVIAERSRADALHADMTAAIRRTDAALANIDARTRATASRLEAVAQNTAPGPIRRRARRSTARAVRGGRRFVLRPGRKAVDKGLRSAEPAARRVVEQLPAPARFQFRRVRSLLRRALADPAPTARAVARKVAPKVESAAARLPPPAQEQLRKGRARLLRARAEPGATAKRAVGRLPPQARPNAVRALRALSRVRNAGTTATAEPRPKASPAPKGPALRQWKDAYKRMVDGALPAGAPWLVVMPGSPKEVGDVAPNATTFPHTRGGRAFADDLAHIAHLEALRFNGHRFLVLPEGSRPWFRRQTELRDHVVRTYRTVVDEEGAGAVFDLSESAAADSRSLPGEVNRLASGLERIPAVLDWTMLAIETELPGFATFHSPDDLRLPYLDHSVDLVVVDDTHDLEEARRVACLAVIAVRAGASGIQVTGVEVDDARVAAARGARAVPSVPRTLVWSSPGATDAWVTQLTARVVASGADVGIGAIDTTMRAAFAGYDVVVVVEPNVLPLPGAIEVAVGLAVADPMGAVAGKVVRADGRLEGAGGTVFSDRSVALIAASSLDVRAAWHDYVRPVCWAPGIVIASAALWDRVTGPPDLDGRAFLREWCGGVWAGGGSVVYQPAVAAVRVVGDGGEPSIPLHESTWQRVLDLRPARPGDLSDGAWRFLVARDDVEACRG